MSLMLHLMRVKAGLESVSGEILKQTPDKKLFFKSTYAAFACLVTPVQMEAFVRSKKNLEIVTIN